MSKKIVITLTTEQLEKAKKMYDYSKQNQKDFNLSFDEFLEKIASVAIDTHLQFSEMNESMSKMLQNFSDTLKDGFKMDDALKDFDSMVQDIFKGNVEKDNESSNSKKSDNKKVKN